MFANKIGMKKAWFQNKPGQPHYDLTTPKARARAEAAGAIRIDPRELVKLLNKAPYQVELIMDETGLVGTLSREKQERMKSWFEVTSRTGECEGGQYE